MSIFVAIWGQQAQDSSSCLEKYTPKNVGDKFWFHNSILIGWNFGVLFQADFQPNYARIFSSAELPEKSLYFAAIRFQDRHSHICVRGKFGISIFVAIWRQQAQDFSSCLEKYTPKMWVTNFGFIIRF